MNKKMALILTTAAVMGLAGCSGQTDKTETTAAPAKTTAETLLHRQRQRRQKLPQRQKRKMFPERSHYILPSRRKMHRS